MATGRRAAPRRPTSAVALDICGTFLRLVLAAVWLGAGVAQLARSQPPHPVTIDPIQHARVLDTVGTLLPWFELALGALLLFGIGVRLTATLAAALGLVLFTGATASPLHSLNLPIDQSCLWDRTCLAITSGSDPSPIETLVGSVGFAVSCLWLVARPHTALSVDNLLTAATIRTRRRRRPAHAAPTARARRRAAPTRSTDARPY